MNNQTSFKTVLLALSAGMLLACQQQSDSGYDDAVEHYTSPILATVNGDPITREDVEFTISRTFSDAELLFANDDITEKVLESLIASKAMAQITKKEMGPQALADMDNKVKAYREELLVKEYLTRNATPKPVTRKMVEQYYAGNPEKFGSAKIKTFEQLKAARRLTEAERDRLLADQAQIVAADNWKALADGSGGGYPLVYHRANATPGLLHANLEAALDGLKKGEASNVMFIDGVATVLRVVDTKQTPPKPLHEVSADIRKALAPLQLRQAVKQATEEVIKQAEVERMSSNDE